MDIEFKNESKLKFTDISSEQWRVYHFPNGTKITIIEPLKLNVSDSGGHRLFSKDGVSHYVQKGWVHLEWIVFDGKPNFVK